MTPSDAPTNTERCGGEVEAIRTRHSVLQLARDVCMEPTKGEAIAAHNDRATLLAALAEERARRERMAKALKPLAAIADHYDDREDSGLMLLIDFDVLEPPLLLLHARDARSALASP